LLLEQNTKNDQDVASIAGLTGSKGVEGSVPGDATDGNVATVFSTTVEES
jgi:hypothetical protein